jgi:hypothetical protein
MVDDKESKLRFRADHLLYSKLKFITSGSEVFDAGFISFLKGENGNTQETSLGNIVRTTFKKLENQKLFSRNVEDLKFVTDLLPLETE